MNADDDELDPSDWPAAQLGEEPPKPAVPFQWGLNPAEPAPVSTPAAAPDPLTSAQLPPTAAFATVYQPGSLSEQPEYREQLGYRKPPGREVEPVAPDPSQWLAAPLDPALDGVTEVLEAELVGLSDPQGEGPGASPLDDLFGDGQFRDFSDEPLIAPLPPRQAGGGGRRRAGDVAPPSGARAPIPRNQKILMSVAGALTAALALVALFAMGTRLPALASRTAVTPSASPTATAMPVVLASGPVQPGDYHWDQLLGGECVKPFESAWQDDYSVVDCTTPHPAQLVFRGTFADPASATYPGSDELQKRMTLLCTPATIIDYAVAGTVQDIQVLASYAVGEDDWDEGNHDYFCFVNRSGGGDLTASVAIPQVPVTPTATSIPGAASGKGQAKVTKTAL